jgi:polyphosphate:AMP phosphotransferase
MLETIDLGVTIAPEEFKELKDDLRARLNKAQIEAWQAGLGVIVVLEGWDYSGKASVTRFLVEPLDPRGVVVNVMYPPSREERRYPFAHRYATRIPARKQLGVFLRSWYYHALDARIEQERDDITNRVVLQMINDLERSLADDGYLIVKFWLHIDRKEQKRRRKEYRGNKLLRRWRTGPDDPKQHKRWKAYTAAIEDMLATTNTECARWHPIPATDVRYAQAMIARTLCEQIENALAARQRPQPAIPAVPPPTTSGTGILAGVDLSATITEKEYERRLEAVETELTELQYECVERKRAVVFALEGWDAAGKGGIIRRLTMPLDPRFYAVHPIAAPRGEEAEHHYLWRFWKQLPPAGHWAIFDRTWYGRVLVERVEGFAKPHEWQRAYREINTFEDALLQHGAIVLKYFLHLSDDEQLRRFQAREEVPYKQFKITPEDWRNREKRAAYVPAIEEMIQRTSPPLAPWLVVPANDKLVARLTVLEDAVAKIRQALER